MRYWYDLEFLEDGKTIEPISIGVVAQDGREYYAVVEDAPWDRILQHEWLMQHVVPHLPIEISRPQPWEIDTPVQLTFAVSRIVKPRRQIAQELSNFFADDGSTPELWTWYGAYDHVALMQFWGPMIDRPPHMPMFSHDLKSVAELFLPTDWERPVQPEEDEHNALFDARWNRACWESANEYIMLDERMNW